MKLSESEIHSISSCVAASLEAETICASKEAIKVLSDVCESPIEIMLGTAFMMIGGLVTCVKQNNSVHFIRVKRHNDVETDDCLITVVPQFRWREYRIDFAMIVGRDHRMTVFIECDGHDFHERTKSQAERDRRKDREIQAAGIPIFRFTGSEIYRNPAGCVRSILSATANLLPTDR